MGIWVAATFMDTVNNTAIRTCVQIFLWICVLFLFPINFYWSMVDLQCCVNFCCTELWFIYIYTHTHSFLIFSIMAYHKIEYSSLCYTVRTLLFIHSICNSLHLLTPVSHSIPPPKPSLLASTSLFSMSVILFLFHR